MECSICCQLASERKLRKCPHCQFSCCVTCIEQYIVLSDHDAHCMNCKHAWTSDIVLQVCGASWFGRAYRMHRERLLLARELALMPSTMDIAAYLVNKMEILTLRSDAENAANQIFRLLRSYDESDNVINMINQNMATLQRCSGALQTLQGTLPHAQTATAPAPRPRVFSVRCPGDDCPGFLNENYVCALCKLVVCRRCRTRSGDDHACDPDAVASVAAMLRDTKPCPQCAAPVFKTGGCDQMFCTSCNTAFQWSDLRIVTSNIHNPHYFAWMQRNQQREAPPIAQCPQDAAQFMHLLNTNLAAVIRVYARAMPQSMQVSVIEMHRLLIHNRAVYEHMTHWFDLTANAHRVFAHHATSQFFNMSAQLAHEHGLRPGGLPPSAHANLDLRMMYLTRKIDRDGLKRELVLREQRREREQERLQIARMFCEVCAEIEHAFYKVACSQAERRDCGVAIADAFDLLKQERRNLLTFVNDAAEQLCVRTQRASLIIGDDFTMRPIYMWSPEARKRSAAATAERHEHGAAASPVARRRL